MNSDLRRHVGQPSTENSSRDVDCPFREERRSSTTSVWSHLSFREPSGVVRHSLKKIPILPTAAPRSYARGCRRFNPRPGRRRLSLFLLLALSCRRFCSPRHNQAADFTLIAFKLHHWSLPRVVPSPSPSLSHFSLSDASRFGF
jgi:hypothetical protein